MQEYPSRIIKLCKRSTGEGVLVSTLVSNTNITPKQKSLVLYIWEDYNSSQIATQLSVSHFRKMLGTPDEASTREQLDKMLSKLDSALTNKDQWFDQARNIPLTKVIPV